MAKTIESEQRTDVRLARIIFRWVPQYQIKQKMKTIIRVTDTTHIICSGEKYFREFSKYNGHPTA